MSVADDMKFSMCCMPSVIQIIAKLSMPKIASYEQDVYQATDIIATLTSGEAMAVRVRRIDFLNAARVDFTIRSRRANGVETELAKIARGWCDKMFYGVATPSFDVQLWYIGDLSVFRSMLKMGIYSGGPEISNADGKTFFKAFEFARMPSNFVVAKHVPPMRVTPPSPKYRLHNDRRINGIPFDYSRAALHVWLGPDDVKRCPRLIARLKQQAPSSGAPPPTRSQPEMFKGESVRRADPE